MEILKKMEGVIKNLKTSSKTTIFILSGGAILIGLNLRNYSSKFEAEVACNRSSHYCHHDKETRQILGLDYQESREFKLGWPVIKRYPY